MLLDSEPSSVTILVVDDDLGLLRLIERVLRRENYRVFTAESGARALEWLATHHADLLLLDLKLQDIEGKELINQLEATGHQTPFIIITGQGDERVAVEMMKRGALDYLVKDVRFQEFVPTMVRRALEQLERERKLMTAETVLRQREEQLRLFVEHAPAAIAMLDTRMCYLEVSQRWLTDYGLTGQELRGRCHYDVFPEIADRWKEIHRRCLAGAVERMDEDFFERADGSAQWLRWEIHPWYASPGIVGGIIIFSEDITEHKRLEQDILGISEREQQRISRDLHDSLGQQLAGIELMAQVLEQQLAKKSKPDATHAGEIARLVRQAISHTRDLAHGLSPVMHEPEGLMSALHALAAGTEQQARIRCEFCCPKPVLVMDNSMATHLYRIAQEAISNALKHAHPTRIKILLASLPGHITLAVEDDGAGFRPPGNGRKGMGMRIMNYRAGVIGGTLVVQKGAQRGTTIVCTVHNPPVPPPTPKTA